MSDSLNLNENGDFSFRFDQTRFKLDKFHSTSSDDSTFDEFNNITNQKVLAHSSPIPMSNLQRFKGKKIENECEKNHLDENNEEENDHEKINIKLGLRPIKRNNVIFNSYEELMERSRSDKFELDEDVWNKDFNKKNIKMSLIENKGEEQNFKPKPYENKSVRLSLQESTIDAYKANKKWIDYDNLENFEKLGKSFQELNFNEYSNKRSILDDSGLRRDDDSYLSEFDEVFLNDTKNDYRRNSKWSKINSHGSDSYDENSLQLESSINTNSISSDELSINEHNKLTNLEQLNLNKSNNSKTEDDLEKGLVCYYNDYIKSEYKNLDTLSPTQSQNFDEFVDSLIESTRNIDMNNNDLSRNSETESINTSKTRSLLFFLEGFESNSSRPFLKSINDASFKSSISSVNAINKKKNYSDLKDLEFILMSYFKRLKEVSNDSYLNNEVFIAILTFCAQWHKVSHDMKSKIQQIIELLNLESYGDARNEALSIPWESEETVCNFMPGILKLIDKLFKEDRARLHNSIKLYN